MFKKLSAFIVVIISLLSFSLFATHAFADTFAVSNLTFDHTAGTFSFDYSGYTGGNTSTESVAIHADDESWGYNAEGNNPCTGSTTGHCSGSFTKHSGTFSCSGTIYVQIYGFNAGGYIVSGLTNPDPSCTNHAPQVGTVTVSPNPVQINTSVTASANFTDADSGDTHTATANWGDGTNTNVTCSSVTEPS